MRLFLLLLGLALPLATPVFAQTKDTRLEAMQTGDDMRGWRAVGRLNLGTRGFCTATLIAPDLVLTAALALDKETGARVDVSDMSSWPVGAVAGPRPIAISKPRCRIPITSIPGPTTLTAWPLIWRCCSWIEPIRLPSIKPFGTNSGPAAGDQVSVVSYAQDRAEVP